MSTIPTADPDPTALRPARVMVVDDDEGLLELLAFALRNEGHEVIEVRDGGRLLEELASEPRSHRGVDADLILSDIRMPGMSGLAMLKQLRAVHWTKPVILMTAFVDDETRARAARLGASVLDKPFTLQALCAAVDAALLASRVKPSP
jgi:DNA-binding response OmpR family regulator